MSSISVVIPTYNSADFIGEAIESALNQSLKPFEIIVIDDGSTDNTREVLKKYNKNISYYYQSNHGSGKARNKGIKEAKGEYIAFLDSDDFWDINHLDNLFSVLINNPGSALSYCGKKWVGKKGNLLKNSYIQNEFPSGWIFSNLIKGNYISSSSVVLIKKKVLYDVGFFDENKNMRNAQDYQLWLRVSARHPIASSPKKTVNYRRHENNRTKDVISRQNGLIYSIESASKLINKNEVDERNEPWKINVQERLIKQYEIAAKSLYDSSDLKKARQFCLIGIRKGSHSIKLYFILILTFIPISYHKIKKYMGIK